MDRPAPEQFQLCMLVALVELARVAVLLVAVCCVVFEVQVKWLALYVYGRWLQWCLLVLLVMLVTRCVCYQH